MIERCTYKKSPIPSIRAMFVSFAMTSLSTTQSALAQDGVGGAPRTEGR
jgi:hypothetical protein